MDSNRMERELNQLIGQAKQLPSDHLEECNDWTKEELGKAKKMYQKINQLQTSSKIPSKLFNEARDCCDMLEQWIKRLEVNMTQSHYRSGNLMIDLGTANERT